MAKKPVTSKEFTDAVCAMLKKLHPAMDVEAVVEELLRGHTSPRALPEMPVSQLAHLLPERWLPDTAAQAVQETLPEASEGQGDTDQK